jgi:predicted nucleotidyltransferase
MIDDKNRGLVLEIKKRLPADLANNLKRLIIFGSRAKGESTEDSDLDIIALVNKKTSEVEKELDDIVYQVMWDNDFNPIISLKVFQESNYIDALNKGFSFYMHVEKEGVAV